MNLEELDRNAPVGAYSTLDTAITTPYIEAIPENGLYVEIGVDKGKSLWIARQVAKPSVVVMGVDICEDPEIDGTVFERRDSKLGMQSTFTGKIDVIFIDGDHTYEGCKADIEAWYPYMKEDGVMMFHDCDDTSPGVVQAFDEFVAKIKPKKAYKSDNQRCSMAVIEL